MSFFSEKEDFNIGIEDAFNEVIDNFKDAFGVGDSRFQKDYRNLQELLNIDQGVFKQFNSSIPTFNNYFNIGEGQYSILLMTDDGDYLEFGFVPNPQAVKYSEPTATRKRLTQANKKWIETQGCLEKKIVISGNTGLFPSVNKINKTLPNSGTNYGIGTGLFYLKLIISLLRYYKQQKALDNSSGLKLIFMDYHLEEAWEVDPIDWNHEVTKEQKFQHPYTITLDVLNPYTFEAKKTSPKSLLAQIGEQLKNARELLQNVVSSANYLSDYVTDLEKKIVAPILGIVYLLDSVNQIIAIGKGLNIGDYTKGVVLALINDVKILNDTFHIFKTDKSYDKGDTYTFSYNDNNKLIQDKSYPEGTVEPTNNSGNPYINFETLANSVNDEINSYISDNGKVFVTKEMMKDKIDSLSDIMTEIEEATWIPDETLPLDTEGNLQYSLTDTSLEGYIIDMESLFMALAENEELFDLFKTFENPAPDVFMDVPNINIEKGTTTDGRVIKKEYIKIDDTLEKISYRLYGNMSRWEELKRINDLRYPYIASQSDINTNGWINVLKYGDYIYYISNEKYSQSLLSYDKETSKTLAMSSFERALGVDIKIDSNGDCNFDANANFAKVYGKDNIKQKIRKMFTIKKGSLRASEEMGIPIYVGMRPNTISLLAPSDFDGMVKLDSRLAGTINTNVFKSGNVLAIKTEVIVKNLENPVKVSIREL